MNGKKYEIRFSNGKVLTGCRGGGGLYEVPGEVSREELSGGLRRVEVYEEGASEAAEVKESCILDVCESAGGETRLMYHEVGYEERKELKLRGDVDYLAMMVGVEL